MGPPRSLSVGFVPGVTVTKWRRIWTERLPRTRLELIAVAAADQRAALDEERVEMCFVRLPIDDAQLHLIPLYEEVPVVVVGRNHPLSLFEEVSLADLTDENVLDPADTLGAIDLVAGGAGVLMVPHSIARSHSRRDLVYRNVSDAEPTQIALAWRVDSPSELTEEFIGIVRGRTPNSSRSARPQSERPARPQDPTAVEPVKPKSRSADQRRGRGQARGR